MEIGCGSVDGQASSPAPAPNPSPAPGGTGIDTTPTAADQYVLALSWEPDFCIGRRDPGDIAQYKQECGIETSTGWDASHLALHGLWRDPYKVYDICLADRSKWVQLERSHDWVDEPAVTLSPGVAQHLAEDMPGALSHLEQHEWTVHGSCSGLGQDTFFARSMALQDEVNSSGVRDFVVGHIGQTIGIDELRSSFATAFPGADTDNVVMTCNRGSDMLAEIDIGLVGDVAGSASLATLLRQHHHPDGESCRSAMVGPPPSR